MGTVHTWFRKGQKILVKLNSGEQFVDKFVERVSGAIVTEQRGRTSTRDISMTTIYRSKRNNSKSE